MSDELLVDQRAAAPRQRLEHVADLQLQPALLAGQEAWPARAVRRRRARPGRLSSVVCTGMRLDGSGLLAGTHPVDLARQVFVRHPEGAVAQRAQRPDQRPRHQHDQQQRQQDRGRARSPSRGSPRCAPLRPGRLTAPVIAGTVAVDHLGRRSGRWSEATGASRDCRPVGTFGSEISAVRWTYSRCSCLASGEPTPSTWAHAEQRRRLGTGQGDQRVRSSGSGSSPPRSPAAAASSSGRGHRRRG